MASFAIGINGGGTHTDLIAVSRDREVLARVEAGPANYHNIGIEAAGQTLRAAIADLIAQSGQPTANLAAIGAGLSGLDRPADHAQFEAIFSTIAPGVPLALDNDAIIALIAAAGRPFGIVEICGTGSIGYGLGKDGSRARCGGWGFRLDTGSGHAIGLQALLAVGRDHDGAALPTTLTGRILKRLDLADPTELIEWMYLSHRKVSDFAALAIEVAQAADAQPSDLAAVGIIMRAADALAEDVLTVGRKLGFGASDSFPLVLSGKLLTHCVTLRERFIEAVQAILPHAVPIYKEHDPALGAAYMALNKMGDPWPGEAFDHADQAVPVKRRLTEQRNRLTLDIATRPTIDLISVMALEDQRVGNVIRFELPKLAGLIDAAAIRFKAGGRLIMAGAGTSGRLAVLDAAECGPTFSTDPTQVIGLIAGGPEAILNSREGAEDSENGGQQAIADLNVNANDVVIGVAASGGTPYVIGILKEANARGALTGSICNVPEAPISALSTYPIVAAVGPEVITGSTRLRAGSAQKLILNMFTTGVMVRAGRTFGNLMTDMQANNIKLQGRARVIVAEAAGVDLVRAESLLGEANGEIKTAVVMAKLRVSAAKAREWVKENAGDLNRLEA